MVMSPRNPVLGPCGFLPWFSTRSVVKSGQTVPLEMRTSELMGVPPLIPVMSSTVGASPRFAQSGTHPVAVGPPRASSRIMAFALIVFLPAGVGNTVCTLDMPLPSALYDPRRDEQQQLVVRAGHEAVAEQVTQDRHVAQEGRRALRGLLVALVDAADDRRGPVPHEHLGLRGLRVDGRDPVDQV